MMANATFKPNEHTRFQRRPYRTFLSHSSDNQGLVATIHTWLQDKANITSWLDAENLDIGTKDIETFLEREIAKCQSFIVFLSKSSLNSYWVQTEIKVAIEQQKKYKQFNIIPIKLEDCQVPEALKHIKWLSMHSQVFTFHEALEILRGLYYETRHQFPNVERVTDIYIARGWRVDDPEVDYVCHRLAEAGFRLIGDDEDQPKFSRTRISDIISGCGGLVAILPDRGNGTTSSYTLQEIEIAQRFRLPYFIVTTPQIEALIDEKLKKDALAIVIHDQDNPDRESPALQKAIDSLHEQWTRPINPFYTTLFTRDSSETHLNNNLKKLAEIVTAMPCRTNFRPRQLENQIRNAHHIIFDTSSANANIYAEIGIAIGARKSESLNILAHDTSHPLPAALESVADQVTKYSNDLDLLGEFHQIIRPFRRHILNLELT